MSPFWIERAGRRHPLHRPEDVRPYLGEPDRHWRPGYSAAELAGAWIGAGDVPRPVRAVLDTEPDLAGLRLEAGLFEQQTALGSPGRASQTDLLAVMSGPDGGCVIGVEGKRDEPFGPRVAAWNDGPGKAARLQALCARLSLDPGACGDLRYQLLHRTAAALIEAEQRDRPLAIVLVHSFSPDWTSFDDFAAFAARMGAPVRGCGVVSAPIGRCGRALRFAWVHDPRDLA